MATWWKAGLAFGKQIQISTYLSFTDDEERVAKRSLMDDVLALLVKVLRKGREGERERE